VKTKGKRRCIGAEQRVQSAEEFNSTSWETKLLGTLTRPCETILRGQCQASKLIRRKGATAKGAWAGVVQHRPEVGPF